MSCAISSTAVSFISPAAEVDFDLNSTTKGVLNGAPFLGKYIVDCMVVIYNMQDDGCVLCSVTVECFAGH